MHRLTGSPVVLSQVVVWKLLQSVRRLSDRRLGGHARRVASGAAWAREWRVVMEQHDRPMRAWRERTGRTPLWLPDEPLVWAAETCSDLDLQSADHAARGEFDLLGTGIVRLGDPPAWRRDLYTGKEWPKRPMDYSAVTRNDGSDIRTVWELSRCRHFLALARAYAKTRDSRYREAFTRHVSSFIADNPLGMGPHWLSPMDAGIRAANWLVAAEIFAEDREIPVSFWEAMLASLHTTGSFVERHLEWHPVHRGNHYVANGVALVYLGTFFSALAEGRRWLRRGIDILEMEIRYQTGSDGVSFEGSLAYHRFVTECFAWAARVLDRAKAARSDEYEKRLRMMYAFIDAYLPSTDLAPMLGDADDGRLHAVSAAGEIEPRAHRLGLPDGWWPGRPATGAAFRDGGFYILRDECDHLIVRCGAVGLQGAGSHDHNDQLSFELCIAGRRVVSDSGTFTYTRDLAARFAFRSTAAHSVIQIGGDEQNPIAVGRPWRILEDRARARCLEFVVSDDRQVFEGMHSGFMHRSSRAVCRRRIEYQRAARTWTILDVVDGSGIENIAWRLHLVPTAVEVTRRSSSQWVVRMPGTPTIVIDIELPPALELVVMQTEASDRYGVRYERPCLLARGDACLPVQCRATFRTLDA